MNKKIIITVALAAVALLLLKKKQQSDEVALRADTPAFGIERGEIYYDKNGKPMIARMYA